MIDSASNEFEEFEGDEMLKIKGLKLIAQSEYNKTGRSRPFRHVGR